jgi:methylmalonyl-CoA mutase N-terminal domain/subunit
MTSGIVAGIEQGWFIGKIADAADDQQRALDAGDRKIVGVNAHTSTITEPLEILHISEQVEQVQNRALAERRSARDNRRVEAALAELKAIAAGTGNLIPPMLEAVRAEATVGEVCSVLREVFGGYREPAMF